MCVCELEWGNCRELRRSRLRCAIEELEKSSVRARIIDVIEAVQSQLNVSASKSTALVDLPPGKKQNTLDMYNILNL